MYKFLHDNKFLFLWDIVAKSAIAELYGQPILSFRRNFQTIFQSVYTILHFYQQSVDDPFSLYPH